MREKIEVLRTQEGEISDEIKMNEELGQKVRCMVESKATQTEFSKYELFIGELNKIVALLLSLTQRLHRYELMLQDLDISEEEDKQKRVSVCDSHHCYQTLLYNQRELIDRSKVSGGRISGDIS